MARVHIATPAEPPATMTALKLSLLGSCPAGVIAFLIISYTTKYAAEPGPSRATVARVPR